MISIGKYPNKKDYWETRQLDYIWLQWLDNCSTEELQDQWYV